MIFQVILGSLHFNLKMPNPFTVMDRMVPPRGQASHRFRTRLVCKYVDHCNTDLVIYLREIWQKKNQFLTHKLSLNANTLTDAYVQQ
jgi:hypothetical protein